MTTQNYARVGTIGQQANRVLETWRPPVDVPSLTPADVFVAWIAAEFLACPNNVERDWLYDPVAHTYSAPEDA